MRLAALLLLSGCAAPGTASHLPPLVLWPVAAIGAGIENAGYDARRNMVKAHLLAHETALRAELSGSPGPALRSALDIAGVRQDRRGKLIDELRSPGPHRDGALSETRIEAMTVILMVYGK